MRMYRTVSIAAILAAILLACVSAGGNGYAAATLDEQARMLLYVQAGSKIKATLPANRTAEWDQFEALQREIRAADNLVFADLTAWKDSGVKPPGYDTHARTLHDAQDKVISLQKEVAP